LLGEKGYAHNGGIETGIYIKLHGKNDFARESKILLDTDKKIILLES